MAIAFRNQNLDKNPNLKDSKKPWNQDIDFPKNNNISNDINIFLVGDLFIWKGIALSQDYLRTINEDQRDEINKDILNYLLQYNFSKLSFAKKDIKTSWESLCKIDTPIDLIDGVKHITNSSSSGNRVEVQSSNSSSAPNSDLNIQIIKEQKQMVLALENQINSDPINVKSAEGSDEVVSSGVNVADKKENTTEVQNMITADDYLIVTYKADELFVDDIISKKLRDFLNKAKVKYPKHEIVIYSYEIKNVLSATISKQISLARTMSIRNLIKKFGYEKKDIKIDLGTKPEIKEDIDPKNGYIVIKIVK